jgi:hypothetical protein
MTYRSILLAAIVLFVTSATALAQDVAKPQSAPRVDVFVGIGPEFVPDGHGRSGPGSGRGVTFDTSVAVNVGRRMAVVVDNVTFGKSSNLWTFGFMVGPRVRFGGPRRRVTGFAQALVGLYRWNASSSSANGVGALGVPDDTVAAQAAIAAGVDYRISKRVSWRIVQVEQRMRFGTYDRSVTGVSTGIVFGLGGR